MASVTEPLYVVYLWRVMATEYDFLAFVFTILSFLTTLVVLVIVVRLVNTMGVMYGWHNKDDANGVKLWYFPRSLEDAIAVLARNIERMEAATRAQIEKMETTIKAQTDLLLYLKSKDKL